MEQLVFTINVMLPILLPVLLGYFLKRIHFFNDALMSQGNKLIFRVFLPILLFSNLYLADLSLIDWPLVGYGAGMIVAFFILGYFVTLFFPDRRQKGVLWQACFRSNYAIIGIPLATMLAGESAGVSASVVAAVSVPIFNTLGVIALSIYSNEEGKKFNLLSTLKKIITNPLILGVLSGLVVCIINTFIGIDAVKGFIAGSDSNIHGMKFISDTISMLAKVTTPFALIILGGRFEFKKAGELWKQLTVSTVVRLIVTPLIALPIAYLIGFRDPVDFAILIALFATPIAVATAPMAAEMGADEELAGQIVVWNSALSSISLFLIIWICALVGIF